MTVPRLRSRPLLGKVIHFDDVRGLGTIRADDGSELSFHSKSVTDGSAPIGARVAFVAVAGHLGKVEAAGITMVTLSGGWDPSVPAADSISAPEPGSSEFDGDQAGSY